MCCHLFCYGQFEQYVHELSLTYLLKLHLVHAQVYDVNYDDESKRLSFTLRRGAYVSQLIFYFKYKLRLTLSHERVSQIALQFIVRHWRDTLNTLKVYC